MSLLRWKRSGESLAGSIPVPSARYQSHVESLATTLGCRIVQQVGMPGMMYVEFGYVEGPVIQNQFDYLVMLHELGHVYHGHTQGRPPKQNLKFYFENGVLKSEAQAWEWALDNCLDDLQPESRYFMWNMCLGSYYQGSLAANGKPKRLTNGDRGYVEFLYDKPDAYFWAVANRIRGTHDEVF